MLGAPQTSKVERRGVLAEAVYLNYSQERLASYGLQPADLVEVLNARNITLPGGSIDTGSGQVVIGGHGPMTLAALTASYLEHLEHHLEQIFP